MSRSIQKHVLYSFQYEHTTIKAHPGMVNMQKLANVEYNFFLFGMKLKKSAAKTHKNEKTLHLNGCFKSIQQFQSNL